MPRPLAEKFSNNLQFLAFTKNIAKLQNYAFSLVLV